MFEVCINDAVTLILTGVNAFCDIKRREILFIPTCTALLSGLIFKAANGEGIFYISAGFFPGLILLAIAIMLKGEIGIGDALVVIAVGAWNPPDETVVILMGALLCASAGAGIILIISKKNSAFPFVPFLAAGVILKMGLY